MTNSERNRKLDLLAQGSRCPKCKAGADESCRTAAGRATVPHQARIDRAVDQHLFAKAAL